MEQSKSQLVALMFENPDQNLCDSDRRNHFYRGMESEDYHKYYDNLYYDLLG